MTSLSNVKLIPAKCCLTVNDSAVPSGKLCSISTLGANPFEDEIPSECISHLATVQCQQGSNRLPCSQVISHQGICQNMYDRINCLAAKVNVFLSITPTCQNAEQSTNLIVVPLCLAREATLSLLSSHRAPSA